jgi:hypothetical protein
MKWVLRAPMIVAACLAAGGAAARTPVVVELFTAQGCVSCEKSNAFAATLADRADVTALTFNVDYWDYLGWKDTFAQPEFTERQRAYDKRFGLQDVYTPQFVINGEAQASGDKQPEVEDLIRKARSAVRAAGPRITPRADGTVAVERGSTRRPAEVWLVRYDPRTQAVQVKEGDNRGQTVSGRNIVRQLADLGVWNGQRRIFHLPAAAEEGLTSLLLIQSPKDGRILEAFRIRS